MVQRLHIFLGLFAFVSYLETIGNTYTVASIQSIERQFHISSKLSGFLVSAHELSYVPTVIFISYFGSRGNRARWIGVGTLIMAAAKIIIATSNFMFPTINPEVNLTEIGVRLMPEPVLLTSDATLRDYFNYELIRDRIPMRIRDRVLERIELSNSKTSDFEARGDSPQGITYNNHTESFYSIDEPLISQALMHMDLVLRGTEDERPLLDVLRQFAQKRNDATTPQVSGGNISLSSDIKALRKSASAPFDFCNRMVNDLRHALKALSCDQNNSGNGPLFIIFLSMITLGIGRTMPWALGIPLIDDNAKNSSTPVYFAVISFIKILGPICGFLIGSVINKLYYTWPSSGPAGLSPADPTWIGAWWLGFLLIGISMIPGSLALYFFPESSRKNKVANKDAAKPKLNANGTEKMKLTLYDRHVKSKDDANKTKKERLREFAQSYKEVLQSRVYTSSVIGRVMDVLAFKGYLVFLPKYLENHFGIPQYRVHSLMAMFGVFGFACGAMTGGFIMRRFKLNGRGATLFIFVVSLINTLLFFSKAFIGCHSVVNSIGLHGQPTNFNYSKTCNMECGCESARLFPVCDPSGHPFYSPCHAGCRHVSVIDLSSYKLEFSECDCAPGGVVKKEFCHDNCRGMTVLFFVTVIAGAYAAGCALVPGMMILLRAVPPSTRSISLGLQGFLISLFGTLPSPFLWGSIIDSACMVWDSVCEHRGTCIIYDPAKLRVRMHLTYAGIRLISTLNDLYVFAHAKHLNLLDEKSEADEEEAEKSVVKENIAMNVITE
ncbi:hypothetical protein M3Y94_00823200 [Aphelenchoides besseyi]|nr:hypothetical protein M3Y94_00823200 [Aphelenchoides besseyi]KAI6227095.1 hypothetical protein M3Y95_00690500 [Aphelenchoides besseyi]